jgi:seryl-tRNA synthetase
MQEREKEISKIDACIDGTRKDIYELIKETQKNQSKIEALWTTMQNIFPDKVPKRAADRHNG